MCEHLSTFNNAWKQIAKWVHVPQKQNRKEWNPNPPTGEVGFWDCQSLSLTILPRSSNPFSQIRISSVESCRVVIGISGSDFDHWFPRYSVWFCRLWMRFNEFQIRIEESTRVYSYFGLINHPQASSVRIQLLLFTSISMFSSFISFIFHISFYFFYFLYERD